MNYWRGRLEGLTELPLRTDWPRPKTWTGRGARLPLTLSRTLSRGIKSLSQTHNATLFMTLLAAFQCLLCRYTQHDDIAVGSLIANRNQIEFERLIGMFANAVVLRTDLSGDPTFSEVLRRVRQMTLDAYRNQELPIEEILQALRVPRSLDRNPLFRVMFILQKASSKAPGPPWNCPLALLTWTLVSRGPTYCSNSSMRMDVWVAGSSIAPNSLRLVRSSEWQRISGRCWSQLSQIPSNGSLGLPLLPVAERKQVVVDWNHDRDRAAPLSPFSERFDRQVERTPDAVAVSVGRLRLSYRELAARASAIAGRLCREDVRRDEVVVLFTERGIDFLAAMIAVQRAGGAFLPLDPMMPAARLAQIIQTQRRTHRTHHARLHGGAAMTLSGLRRGERPRVLILEELNAAISQDSMPARSAGHPRVWRALSILPARRAFRKEP